MPGFFEALENFKPRKRAKPVVLIDGQKIEVSLDKFNEVMAHGQENFNLKKGKIVRKVVNRIYKHQTILCKADKGYKFLDGHPYWPDSIVEGGFQWKTEQE